MSEPTTYLPAGFGDTLTSAFSGMISESMTVVLGIIPACLPILALTAVVGLAIKWFRKLTKS
jgi:predicted histidine transporter YuiF (NhaC family)